MRSNFQRHMRLLVLALTVGGLLAACGSGGEEEPLGEPGGTATQVESTGVTPTEAAVELAPELVGLEGWVNSPPLTLAALRGEPVLLVFWASW